MSVPLRTKWLLVQVPLQSLKLQIPRLSRNCQFLDIQAAIECEFTLKRVRNMIKTYWYYWLLIKNKNPRFNITQGGAFRQQKVLRILKARDPELYKLYKKVQQNDESDCINSKITFYLKWSGAFKKNELSRVPVPVRTKIS